MMGEEQARRRRYAAIPDRMAPPPRAPDHAMLADVLHGLRQPQKELSPKYFYDERGAALFDAITRLPEYYLTRTERQLIAERVAPWLRRFQARTLVELGAGSGEKTRLLLDALPVGATYIPVDISEPYLAQIAAELGRDYPQLSIAPVLADITAELNLPNLMHGPAVIAFLGSTIGNFDDAAARMLLRRVRAVLRRDDRLLLGVDLRKDRATLEAAYNDTAGVTADFNLNVLRVLNRELGADFDLAAFRHHAFYDQALGRIEMHLIADTPQTVHIAGHAIDIAAGESIRTEISAKYDVDTVSALLGAAGLTLEEWIEADGRYAVAIASPVKARKHNAAQGPFAHEGTAAAWLRLHAFPRLQHTREPKVGAEIELIAHDADTHEVARYDDGTGPLGRLLDAHARRLQWCSTSSAKGAPRWAVPGGGAVTLEPGGQIEYSSPAFVAVRDLLRDLRDTIEPLAQTAADAGITLLGVGIDPHNDLAHSPLQIETDRYRAMDAYFATRGEAGRRMMRQTAAVQVNIDPSYDPLLTWRVLNAMAPCILAMTANSARYAGADTGHASYRAATWRELDPSRTGLFTATGDVAVEYARFAIDAGPIVNDPFGAGWRDHLTTLFPEVRPRGWYELRTADAMPTSEYAKLLLPVTAVLRDERALNQAAELLGTPSTDLLERAGRHGLVDVALRDLCIELLAIAAARADGADAEELQEIRSRISAHSSGS